MGKTQPHQILSNPPHGVESRGYVYFLRKRRDLIAVCSPHSVIPRAILPLVFSDVRQQRWNWNVLEVSSKNYRLALPATFGKAWLTIGNAAVVGSPSAGGRPESVVVSRIGLTRVRGEFRGPPRICRGLPYRAYPCKRRVQGTAPNPSWSPQCSGPMRLAWMRHERDRCTWGCQRPGPCD